MKLNSVAYRKNTFSELREPAAIGQKALRKSWISFNSSHRETEASADWKVKSRWLHFTKMGAKFLSFVFFLLFLSPAMAYLGSYRFGKRNLVEKVAITD